MMYSFLFTMLQWKVPSIRFMWPCVTYVYQKSRTSVVVCDILQKKTHRMHQVALSRKSIQCVSCNLTLDEYTIKLEPVQLFVICYKRKRIECIDAQNALSRFKPVQSISCDLALLAYAKKVESVQLFVTSYRRKRIECIDAQNAQTHRIHRRIECIKQVYFLRNTNAKYRKRCMFDLNARHFHCSFSISMKVTFHNYNYKFLNCLWKWCSYLFFFFALRSFSKSLLNLFLFFFFCCCYCCCN